MKEYLDNVIEQHNCSICDFREKCGVYNLLKSIIVNFHSDEFVCKLYTTHSDENLNLVKEAIEEVVKNS